MRGGKHGDRARNAGGSAAAHRFDERQWLAVLVQKHVRCCARRRGLSPIDRADDTRAGLVVHQEGAAADAGALRLDEAEHGLDGHRGVDGLAALLENLHPRIHRQRIGGDHDAGPLCASAFVMPVQ